MRDRFANRSLEEKMRFAVTTHMILWIGVIFDKYFTCWTHIHTHTNAEYTYTPHTVGAARAMRVPQVTVPRTDQDPFDSVG